MQGIAIIGTGVMGSAIARGIRKTASEAEILLYDADRELLSETAHELSAEEMDSAKALVLSAQERSLPVLIAIKPQHLHSLAQELHRYCRDLNIVSIAAGRSIETLSQLFPGAKLIRFMPNIAARVGESVVAVSPGNNCPEAFVSEAKEIAGSIGKPVIMDESLISAFTGLSGSGIAYGFAFIHALALGGTENGIAYPTALKIALHTMKGAISLIDEEESNPAELIPQVCSAGGTTIQGIAALESGRFTHTVMQAVAAAAKKAESMEKGR